MSQQWRNKFEMRTCDAPGEVGIIVSDMEELGYKLEEWQVVAPRSRRTGQSATPTYHLMFRRIANNPET